MNKKYLYIVFSWGGEPVAYRTKIDLVNHFDMNNSRVVDGWFENNWFSMIKNQMIIRVEIPKIKSKIRHKK